MMNNIEETISDHIFETGLNSDNIKLLKENANKISKDFIVDILAENVNLYTNLNLLIEFLPLIWGKNDNSSSQLLVYLSGIAHRLFYFAREYPLGKKIPDYLNNEIENIHQGLHDCQEFCTFKEINEEDFAISKINSFEDLIDVLEIYPRYPTKLFEMFQIVADLFHQFAVNSNQKLKNVDELSLYLSRCLIFWRLQSMTDKELITCLKASVKKYSGGINLIEFEDILALELQNYQFLQLGIDRFLVKTIVESFEKMR